jgi:hypothetical protein
MNTLVSVMALSTLLGVGVGDEKRRAPSGPPPLRMVAKLYEGHEIIARREIRLEWTDKRFPGLVQSWKNEQSVRCDIKEIRIYDARGRRISRTAIPGLLQKKDPVPVLVSADGKQVDPSHLRDVKPTTLILVFPARKLPVWAPERIVLSEEE